MPKNISRVLKPDGLIIFLYDVSTQNPLVNFFRKKNPENYQEKFLEHDGHIGYEEIEENITNFEKNNFSIIYNKGLQKTVFQDPSVYQKFLGIGNFLQNYLLKVILFLSTVIVILDHDCGRKENDASRILRKLLHLILK